jgi:hypothetical protein
MGWAARTVLVMVACYVGARAGLERAFVRVLGYGEM